MYSEIVTAGFDTYYDNSTSSMIGYLASEGKDSYTPAGTWINYLDEKTVGEQVTWAMEKGLGGAFAWDCTMDSIENG
jgi:GH18 family chitinase